MPARLMLPTRSLENVPAWTVIVDVLSTVLILFAVSVLLFGGSREVIGPLDISLRSAGRIAAAAAVLIAVRHALVRSDPLHVRAIRYWQRVRVSPPVASVWMPFAATRVGVLLAGYFAVLTIGFEPGTVRFRVSYNEWLNLLARWDAQWYLEIARRGYSWNGNPNIQQTVVFFPVVPVGMHVGAFFAGGHLLYGGLVVALCAFFFALVYLYRVAWPFLGDQRARATVWALAAYPFAVYFSAPYTEAIFLLGCLGAFFHFDRGEWRRAALWGLLAGLVRPNGFLLAAPLAVLAAERFLLSRRRLAAGDVVVIAAPVIAMLCYSAYMYERFGDPLVWLKGQAAWNRSFAGVWPGTKALVMDRYDHISRFGWYHYTLSSPFDAMHSVAALFALASILPTARRFGAAFALFTAINLLPPLITGGTMSIGRMTSVLFPAFMWIGAALPERYVVGVIAAFCVGQGLIAALFFTWRAVY